jgi:hypothetical protein
MESSKKLPKTDLGTTLRRASLSDERKREGRRGRILFILNGRYKNKKDAPCQEKK